MRLHQKKRLFVFYERLLTSIIIIYILSIADIL